MLDGGRLAISAGTDDGVMELSVADTGTGIEAERPGSNHGAALFDEGAGAGPGACNFAVDRGKKPGQTPRDQRAGPRSTFTIQLTASPSDGEPMTRREAPDILVVDDDPDIRDNLSDILSDLGYRVDLRTDGQSALELVAREALRRRASGSENARDGRADALSRNQEA